MKKLFFTLAFIAAALTSCMTEQTVRYDGINSVKVSIDVEAPQLNGTRGDEAGMNSGLGAIDNFSDAEWAKYDLRYIFEVYDVTEGYANLETPIKKREVKTYDKYESTSFDMRLIPNRKYKFVVWADFVEQGKTEDLNYNTTKLNNITRMGDVSPMNEAMDAYFIQKSIYVEGKLNETLELTRPFGKIRVIATDVDEVNLNSDPSSVEVKFYNQPTLLSLNALTGQAETETKTVTYSYNIAKGQPYSAGYDAEGAGSQTLFADYIFAQTAYDGAQEVNFTMTVKSADGRTIREHDFNTQIPLERNYLTTIIGNLLTTETEFYVSVDDDFTGEYISNPDAPQLATPEVNTAVDGNVVTLSWNAVENADFYTVSYNNTTVTTTETSIEFTLDYETEYTFTVKAGSNNTANFNASDVATTTVTTGALVVKLDAPVVTATIEEYKNVVLNWANVANADYYSVSYNNNTENTTNTSIVLNLDYNTEYTFSVQAHSNDTVHFIASDVATVKVTTEAEPVVEYIYLQPNSNWVVDGARFAVYTWVDGAGDKWVDMVDSDGDGIYEVVKSELNSNIIFCRMNPSTTNNNWDNKWNQTTDLVIPTDGSNLYTIADGAWDKGNGTWSTYNSAPVAESVEATLKFDDKSKRTTFSTSQQVWEENGIALINDKASSTSSVADYSKPIRCYAKSKITVTAPGKITSIVFDCNSTSYATALKNSIGSTAAVSVSSDKVTVTLDGSADNFVIKSLTAQVRIDSVTVTYNK